jgi:hypothetical protein
LLHALIISGKPNRDVTPTLAIANHCRKRFQSHAHRKMALATAAAGVLIWPNPPPSAVNVVLLRRLHIDSGGVSALLLLGFGFGESKAKGFVSPDISQSRL